MTLKKGCEEIYSLTILNGGKDYEKMEMLDLRTDS